MNRAELMNRTELLKPGRYSSIPAAILRDRSLSPTAKLVVGALLAHLYGGATECWPSVAKIAERIGAGRSAVKTAIAALEAAGILGVRRRNGRSTRYQFLAAQSEPTGSDSDPVARGPGPPSESAAPTGSESNPVEGQPTTITGSDSDPVPDDSATATGSDSDRHRVGFRPATGSDSDPETLLHSKKQKGPPQPPPAGGESESGPPAALWEQIDAAHQMVFGLELPTTWRRRIAKRWADGERTVLGRIDAAAIAAARDYREKAKLDGFGLGVVLAYLRERSAESVRTKAAESARARRAAESEQAAESERAYAEVRAAAQAALWKNLAEADRARWRKEAIRQRPALAADRKAATLIPYAACLAWHAANTEEVTA